jgi:hypothetical protein
MPVKSIIFGITFFARLGRLPNLPSVMIIFGREGWREQRSARL